jgi:hypothetical protein
MAQETRRRGLAPAPSVRGVAARKRGPAVATVTAYVSAELGRRLRVRAASDGRTVSAVVAEALERHLG